MRALMVVVLAIAMSLGFAGPASARLYRFSYEFPPGEVPGVVEGFGTVVTGSFEGTDDGTFATIVSNLNVAVNGAPFPAALVTGTWTGSGFASGPVTLAFDGAKNNLVFGNCLAMDCVTHFFLFVGAGALGPVYGRVGVNSPVLQPQHLGSWDAIGGSSARRGTWKLEAVAAPVTPGAVTVVEYYHAGLDHYFITWGAGEIAALDAGIAIKGWTRTGRTFQTFPAAQAGTTPVCRFYIPPDKGNSHFFGRGVAECTATGARNPTFVLEEPAYMHMILPSAGVCPALTMPIYRVFSNRPDANHRYMTDPTLRDAMVARGWLAEGDGPDLVVMCAPA
ncbi:MAG: hypothetical protein ABI920_02250 [Casimicrobiaceae bacterium]